MLPLIRYDIRYMLRDTIAITYATLPLLIEIATMAREECSQHSEF